MRYRCGTAVVATLALVVPAQAAASTTYIVRPGDTLSAIAAAHGTTVKAVACANGVRRPNLIRIGARLVIPASGAVRWPSRGVYHVRRGDTLSAIALRYRTTVAALGRLNGIRSVDLIPIGARLRVPVADRAVGGGWVRARIDYWAGVYGVHNRLARALAWMESGYQIHLTSHAGAWGTMQVTPDAWDFVETFLLGTRVARTADGNIRIGVAYLRQLLREFGGNERKALAAWYQGPASVRKRGVLRESKVFVANVLALKSSSL